MMRVFLRKQILLISTFALVCTLIFAACGDDNHHSESPESSAPVSGEMEEPFPSVIPSVEWDDMPLHKCIYCAGTARMASGAWCCESCGAVFGEEDFAQKVSFDAFKAGIWTHGNDGNVSLKIEVVDQETILVTIRQDGRTSQVRVWSTQAKWDALFGLFRYEMGLFYIHSGKLYWVDYENSAGYDWAFEYAAS
jgi:hypothetical protein